MLWDESLDKPHRLRVILTREAQTEVSLDCPPRTPDPFPGWKEGRETGIAIGQLHLELLRRPNLGVLSLALGRGSDPYWGRTCFGSIHALR